MIIVIISIIVFLILYLTYSHMYIVKDKELVKKPFTVWLLTKIIIISLVPIVNIVVLTGLFFNDFMDDDNEIRFEGKYLNKIKAFFDKEIN